MTTEQASQLSTLYNQYILHEGDKVLLWTNPSPTSSFAAQTITLSTMSNYRYLIIECYTNTDSSIHTDNNVGTEYNLRSTSATETFWMSGGANNYRSAIIYKTNSTIVFGEGNNHIGTVDNTLCILSKIYGI